MQVRDFEPENIVYRIVECDDAVILGAGESARLQFPADHRRRARVRSDDRLRTVPRFEPFAETDRDLAVVGGFRGAALEILESERIDRLDHHAAAAAQERTGFVGAAEKSDPSETALHQMPGRHHAAGEIVEADRVQRDILPVGRNQHRHDAGLHQPVDDFAGRIADHQYAVRIDQAVENHLVFLVVHDLVRLPCADIHPHIAVPAEKALHAAQRLRHEVEEQHVLLFGQRAEQKFDIEHALLDPRLALPRNRTRIIPEILHRRHDAAAGVLVNLSATVQNPGHGCDRHSGGLRHLSQCHRLFNCHFHLQTFFLKFTVNIMTYVSPDVKPSSDILSEKMIRVSSAAPKSRAAASSLRPDAASFQAGRTPGRAGLLRTKGFRGGRRPSRNSSRYSGGPAG